MGPGIVITTDSGGDGIPAGRGLGRSSFLGLFTLPPARRF